MAPFDIDPFDVEPLDMEPPDADCAIAAPATPKLMNRARAAVFPKIFICFLLKKSRAIRPGVPTCWNRVAGSPVADKSASFTFLRPRCGHAGTARTGPD